MKNPTPGNIKKSSEYIKIELTLNDNVRKKNMILKKSRMDFNSINAYITNVDTRIISS